MLVLLRQIIVSRLYIVTWASVGVGLGMYAAYPGGDSILAAGGAGPREGRGGNIRKGTTPTNGKHLSQEEIEEQSQEGMINHGRGGGGGEIKKKKKRRKTVCCRCSPVITTVVACIRM